VNKISASMKENSAKLAEAIERHLKYSIGKRLCEATKTEVFNAVALAVREFAIDSMFDTSARYEKSNTKRIYYLSVEYLIGRSLENNLRNLGIYDALRQLDLDIDLDEVFDTEYDPALGNGGLGRLAACFLDSMATLGLPGFGYGINYKFGLFRQNIMNGYQVEEADSWLESASPWQLERPDRTLYIPLHGRVESIHNADGTTSHSWVDCDRLIGVPYDMPIVGFGGKTVNYLRLFSARTDRTLDITTFNEGGYMQAVEKKIKSETVSKVLYPSDAVDAGKELRLTQQYFFVACAIKDIIRRYLEKEGDLRKLPEKVVIQLNDTHPALAIPELMRTFIDENGMDWDQAWEITRKTFAFTNHTLLPEALEKWPVSTLEKVLPRHLQIIYEINKRFLDVVSAEFPEDHDKLARMSIVEGEGDHKMIRMANLSMVGSFSINGVAELHSELIKTNLTPDYFQIWPNKFNNKTNGVTPRRWLLSSNSELADLITNKIGDDWVTDLTKLKKLEKFAKDDAFVEKFAEIKLNNKKRLAKIIQDRVGVTVDPNSLFDVQVKRMHEYKRQLLNVMNIIHEYYAITKDGVKPSCKKTYIFAGKAAPSYTMAKLIIKLINNVAKVVNNDPAVKDWIKVVFIPDYKVSVAERIFPAANISEQISTAGLEASGTGNMKFTINGALTVGTFDGANIEIREEVGADNFYLFGLRAEKILQMRAENSYNPWDYFNNNSNIRRVMNSLASNAFCEDEHGLIFKPIYDNIMNKDYFFVLADLEDYMNTQRQVAKDFLDQKEWNRKAILNTARSGKFSSDRTISQYAKEIWNVKPVIKD